MFRNASCRPFSQPLCQALTRLLGHNMDGEVIAVKKRRMLASFFS